MARSTLTRAETPGTAIASVANKAAPTNAFLQFMALLRPLESALALNPTLWKFSFRIVLNTRVFLRYGIRDREARSNRGGSRRYSTTRRGTDGPRTGLRGGHGKGAACCITCRDCGRLKRSALGDGAGRCHDAPCADWTLQQLREVIGFDDTHRYLIHDRDRIFARRLDRGARRECTEITPIQALQTDLADHPGAHTAFAVPRALWCGWSLLPTGDRKSLR
jgi:hypothetical protein